MIYIPIVASVALAAVTILEKITLKKKSLNIKAFQTATFLSAFLVMIPLLFFFWKFDPQALLLQNILIFLAVIIIGVLANIALFTAIKHEKISTLEPALILEPLFTIILSIIFSFFTQGLFERNLNIIIPALIAGTALVLVHVKKHHLEFNKYFIAAIAGSFLFALELVTTRLILDYYSPISFYFLRCLGIFLVSIIIFRPKFSKIKPSTRVRIFEIGAFWVLYRVLVYYGYLQLGVISTTLIVMLGPVLVYAFAKFILKEKLHWKDILASIIIIACVAYVILT